MARVLVVGATGILAPAAAALAARGDEVTGVARSAAGMPDGVQALTVDARAADAFGTGRWQAALVYAPAVSDGSLEALRRVVDGRVVVVRVSAAADPARGEFALEPEVLQLGWAVDEGAPSSTRWHTPDEVSRAALAVLADGRGRVLGAVRPWPSRPA